MNVDLLSRVPVRRARYQRRDRSSPTRLAVHQARSLAELPLDVCPVTSLLASPRGPVRLASVGVAARDQGRVDGPFR